MTDQVQTLLVQAGIDKAKAQESILLLQQLQKAAAGIAVAFKDVGAGASRDMTAAIAQTRAFGDQVGVAERQFNEMSTQMIAGRLRRFGMVSGNVLGMGNPIQEALRTGSDIAEFAEATKDLPMIFGQIKDAFMNLPFIAKSTQDALAFFKGLTGGGMMDVPTKLVTGLSELFGAGGPLVLGVVAVGAVALAFKSFVDEVNDNKKVVDEAIKGLDAYYAAIEKGTVESLQKSTSQMQVQLDNAIRERDQLTRTNLTPPGRMGGASLELGGPGGLSGIIQTTITAMETGKRIQELNKEIADLGQKIKGNADASKDAAVIERSATEALIRRSQSEVTYTESLQKATLQSSEQIKARITDLDNQKWAIQGALDTLDKALASTANKETFDSLSAQISNYRDQMKQMTREQQDLTASVLPLVLAREAEKKAVDDLTKGLKDFTTAMQGIDQENAAIAKTAEDRARQDERSSIESNYRKRIDQARANEQILGEEKQIKDSQVAMAKAAAKAAEDFQRQQERADRDFMRSELDATKRFQREELKAEDQFAQERLRAIRDMQEQMTDAARDGDVNAFIQAQRNGEKNLRNLTENHDQQTKDRIEQFAQDRADALERYRQQKADALENYNRQRADTAQQNAETLQAQREHFQQVKLESKRLQDELDALKIQWQREDETRRRNEEDKAAIERLNKLKLDLANSQALVNNYWNSVNAKISSAIISVNSMGNLWGNVGLGYHAGGIDYIPYDNYPALLHRGERVLTAENNRGGGGLTINGGIQIGAGNSVTAQDVTNALEAFQRNIQTALVQSRRLSA